MKKREQIGIIGAGAWGTALAIRLAQNHDILLWAHEAETIENIIKNRENRIFLPHIAVPEAVQPIGDFAALAACPILFFVPPAQFLRSILRAAQPHFMDNAIAVICSKGIENTNENTNNEDINNRGAQQVPALMSEIFAEERPQMQVAILSGPSFAAETAQGLPTALTLAAKPPLNQNLAAMFSMPDFRLYPSNDIIGAQIGGAVKNVLAIACGIAEGRQLGQNARAALIARGIAETLTLTEKLGGRPETLMGLSGMGDIVLTCTSEASRNTSLGMALGKGQKLDDIMRQRHSVSEGVHTAASLRKLAENHGIFMPICFAIDDMLRGHSDIDASIHQLLARDIPHEEMSRK